MATTKYDMTHIDAMNGHEFEHFIAALLRKLGYQNVDVTRGSGDQGVDVLAEKEGVRYAVQCKCYSSDVGNTPVQEVNTGKVIYHCHVGVVVTNRYFTQGAKEAARATGVLLWDRARLQELMIQAESMVQSAYNTEALLKRGFMALEDGEWRKADQFFEQMLNFSAECGDAYLGKMLAEAKAASLEELRKKTVQLDTLKNFTRALQFSSGTQLQALQEINELMKKKWQAKEDARIAMELAANQRRKEEEIRIVAEQKEAEIHLASARKYIKKAATFISAGYGYLVGVKVDGTALAEGDDHYGRCNVTSWTDIIAVTTGGWISEACFTMALKQDHTVIATGRTYGRCSVGSWADIVAIAAGSWHTVGLKSDGTVVAVGKNGNGQCNVSGWTDILAIAAGNSHSVGLKQNGSVVATGSHDSYRNIENWTDIVDIAAGFSHTAGLRSDGTVVVAGRVINNDQYNIEKWTDIIAIASGFSHIVGLKLDGTVVAVGTDVNGQCNVNKWTDVIAVSAGPFHTVGLKSDGTVISTDDSIQGRISKWKLFNSIETLDQERAAAERTRAEAEEYQRRKAEEQRRQEEDRQRRDVAERQRTALETEKYALQTELANLQGLFTGRRRRGIEARLSEIERKLRDL